MPPTAPLLATLHAVFDERSLPGSVSALLTMKLLRSRVLYADLHSACGRAVMPRLATAVLQMGLLAADELVTLLLCTV